jgi:D-alanyl-lipoteichoic acid acyltransferase DltB (MBOAT superfamily)
MLFNSFEFLLFFPIVTILFFLLPHKYRWFHLLVASCAFYMYFVPIYIVILFGTIIVDYAAGILIEQAEGARRKAFLVMSIITNVGVLAVFKYYNFFIENINYGFHSYIPLLRILLPIGLSFHTFQAMSYTIEVYRGNEKAERHFGIYSLYVMFYPQLVAGPIERPQNLLYQFHRKHEFSYENVTNGLRQIAWGLFKKALIADRLAQTVDPVFKAPEHFSATAMCVALFFYAFQIYCDFSGYSDIALGTARVMGFNLMMNFNHPFRAKNLSDFWRRWHISLSTWFNDYFFTPLATTLRNWANWGIGISLFLTFLLSGFWHGAAWNFVIFGVFHGAGMVYEFLTKKRRKKLFGKLPKRANALLSLFFTFTYVGFVRIFFRAATVKDSLYMSKKVFNFFPEMQRVASNRKILTHELLLGLNPITIAIGFICIFFLEYIHHLEGEGHIYEMVGQKPKAMRWGIYIASFLLIAYFGVFDSRQFIYFQF